MKRDLLGLLSRIELFQELSKAELEALARLARLKRYTKGSVIFEAGDEAESVFLIVEGKVRVILLDEEGKEFILAVLGEGQVFGEMALIDSEPRSATVIAETSVEALAISRTDFHELLERYPSISRKLMVILSRRLRKANQTMQSLAYMDVAGRLARFFLDLAREHGQRLGNGWVVVRRPTHAHIAHSIGTSRETVSRVINQFEKQLGIVNKGKFTYIREELLR